MRNLPIPGHALQWDKLNWWFSCECGERPDIQSRDEARRWHREHKAQIRSRDAG